MVIENFIAYVNKKFGFNISASYYSNISTWKQWYENWVKDFHTYSEMSLDGVRHERKLYRLAMAKTICEDWASMLLNDKTEIKTQDETANAWLLGDANGTAGLLGQLDFWNQSNRLVERMMRSGTAAWVVSVDGMAIDAKGRVVTDPTASIAVDYDAAECILPITCKHGKITECAFASDVYYGGKSCIYLQIHTQEKSGYKIENHYYVSSSETPDAGGYEEIPLPAGMAPVVHTGCPYPWFSVITPNLENNIENHPQNGLGMAVFANAEDNLKMCDIAYNNYVRDLRLGGKKLFYNKKLIRSYIDDEGNQHKIAPDDVQQQLFWTDGTSDPDQHAEVYDYNPSLRTSENHAAVQDALNFLSMKCGLGGHFYIFEHDSVTTATQYKGDKTSLVKMIDRHHITIEAGLIQTMRAILWIGSHIMGLPIDVETPVSVTWDSSYISDETEERAQMRTDVTLDLIPARLYVEKYYHVSPEEAKLLTDEAAASIETPRLSLQKIGANR